MVLLLTVATLLSRRRSGSHCGMGSISWALFFLFYMTTTASITTVAPVTMAAPTSSLALSLRWMMRMVVVQGNFDIAVFPCRRGGG